MKYTIETQKCDEGGYIAFVRELKINGDGNTENEAILDLLEVFTDILEYEIKGKTAISISNNNLSDVFLKNKEPKRKTSGLFESGHII